MNDNFVVRRMMDSIDAKKAFLENEENVALVEKCANAIANSIRKGGKILVFGNGGSASDSLHIVGELLGRFQKERPAFSAIALNADVATMTAIANDYSYDEVFSRQVDGLMKNGDVAIGISTSGNSANVVRAIDVANTKGGTTIALTGKDGGILKSKSDYTIVVSNDTTARIQECHMTIYHIICEMVEDMLTD